ncbi:MAG: LytTR family DNA-binding domain-containing protein [Candidatus Cryptobacteroides sp.]
MNSLPRIFKRFAPQFLHMILVPLFFFAFCLIYKPLGVESLLGMEWFGVRLSLVVSIMLLCMVVTRVLYYYIPSGLNYSLYILWCFGEIVLMTFFVAFYLWMAKDKTDVYFDTVIAVFRVLFLSLAFPYLILGLSMAVYEKNKISSADVSENRIKFYDDKHNLRFVVAPNNILYILADVNYVKIYYSESNTVRSYVLRNSMKAIEPVCGENGIIRCHRSYFVNPSRIKILRKDKEGIMVAELDMRDTPHVPVTKRYYDSVVEKMD